MGSVLAADLWRAAEGSRAKGYELMNPRHPSESSRAALLRTRLTGWLDLVLHVAVALDNATSWECSLGSISFFSEDADVRWAAIGFLLILFTLGLNQAILWRNGVGKLVFLGVPLAKLLYGVFGLPAMVALKVWLLVLHPCSEPGPTALSFPQAFEQVDLFTGSLVRAPGQLLLCAWILNNWANLGRHSAGVPVLVFLSLASSLYAPCGALCWLKAFQAKESKLRCAVPGEEALGLLDAAKLAFSGGMGRSYAHASSSVEEPAVADLIMALGPPFQLEKLLLQNTLLADVHGLGEALRQNSTLQLLRLGDNQIEDAAPLAGALRLNTTLVSLHLGRNLIRDVRSFGPALTLNVALRTLVLSENAIEDVAALGGALRCNGRLERLFLDGNKIKDVAPLGEALKGNVALQQLRLDGNQLCDIAPLAAGLQLNNTLQELHLSRNRIGSVVSFEMALRMNRSLRLLSLESNALKDVAPLCKALQFNASLQKVSLSENPIKELGPLLAQPRVDFALPY